jgi:hypothetical protein
MPSVLETIHEPALFWLDGHYSGGDTARGDDDTPIRRELEHISKHPMRGRHLIVIDDLRCFDGQNGYPSLEGLRQFTQELGFSEIEQGKDCIVLQ